MYKLSIKIAYWFVVAFVLSNFDATSGTTLFYKYYRVNVLARISGESLRESSESLVKSSVQSSDSEESSPKMLSSSDDFCVMSLHKPSGVSSSVFSGSLADSSWVFLRFWEASYAALALLIMALNFRFTVRNASRSAGSLDFSHLRSARRRSLFTWWNTCLIEAYHGVGFRLGFGFSFLGFTIWAHSWKGNTGAWGGNIGARGGNSGGRGGNGDAREGHIGLCDGNMGPRGWNMGALSRDTGLCGRKSGARCEIMGACCWIIGLGARTWASSCWNAWISGDSCERITCCFSSSPVVEVWETRTAGNFYSTLSYHKLKVLNHFPKFTTNPLS